VDGARPSGGLAYHLEPRPIVPDTYVFEGAIEHFTVKNGGNILNTGFIVTGAGVIVIQTGPSHRYGEEMRAAIARVTGQLILKVFVVTSTRTISWAHRLSPMSPSPPCREQSTASARKGAP
jgi:hypothetical protein